MAERSRLHLPSLGAGQSAGPPSIDEARVALGGPARGVRTGARVEVDRGGGRVTEGLVVLSNGEEEDVWIGDGIFVRVRAPSRSTPISRPTPGLDAPARDLARFAKVRVGDHVRLRRAGQPLEGRVLELCRYGALVQVETRVIAAGFRVLSAADD